jgi:hypothetical protein
MTRQNNLYNIPGGGLAVIAEYTDQPLVEYKGNPLIEALPPIFSKEEFVDAVSDYPAFDASERDLPPAVRMHCVERLLRFFQPIREARAEKVVSFDKHVNTPSSASGFTMIGVSGVGKTTAVSRTLGLYPQIVLHSEYQGTPLSFYQVVWLKLDCPHAGSLKGLCIDFFLEIDKLLGTNYHTKFGSRQNSEDVMLARMAQIASTHCLGALVIDEMQNLSTAKSGGSEKMLNFFVKLVNTISVPVIRIGTNKAMPILQGDFRQARRGIGQGGVYWERLGKETKRDEEIWHFFVETFFEYQWTRKPAPLDDELEDVLYEESQGIVDIAIKLFMIAQWRAIALETEAITPALIRQVAADSLHLVRPMLDALKSGDPERIAKYSDIKPLDVQGFYEQYRSKVEAKRQSELSKLRAANQSAGHSTDAPSRMKQITLQLMSLDLPPTVAKFYSERVVATRKLGATIADLTAEAYTSALNEGLRLQENVAEEKRKVKPREPRSKSYAHGDLRLIVAEAKRSRLSAYQGLENHGVIKSPTQDVLRVTS